jgi:hypothetical protein
VNGDIGARISIVKKVRSCRGFSSIGKGGEDRLFPFSLVHNKRPMDFTRIWIRIGGRSGKNPFKIEAANEHQLAIFTFSPVSDLMSLTQ